MKCKRCKVEKEILDSGRCFRCQLYVEEYYVKNRQREIARAKRNQTKDRSKINAYKRELNKRHPLNVIVQNAKARARDKKIPFKISVNDLELPEFCPVLGIELQVNDGYAKFNSPTIDRLVPQLGYVKGNVAIISHKANSIKNNATIEELEKVLAWLREQVGNNVKSRISKYNKS